MFDYKDVFMSYYDDMPGLSTNMVVHKLLIDLKFLPGIEKVEKA